MPRESRGSKQGTKAGSSWEIRRGFEVLHGYEQEESVRDIEDLDNELLLCHKKFGDWEKNMHDFPLKVLTMIIP